MILLTTLLARAECPSPSAALDAATEDLTLGRDAAESLARAESAFGCAEASPLERARLLLLHGAARYLAGDVAAAEPYFAAAALADPAYFDERLGPSMRAAWSAARLGGTGRITANRPTRVDGAEVRTYPHPVDGGPHLVQALPEGWAKLVFVPAGDELVVEVPAAPASVATTRGRHSPAWLVAAGVAAAGAGGCAYGAYAQDAAMEEAGTVSAVESAYGTQQGLAYTALGLGVAAATSATLYFVF